MGFQTFPWDNQELRDFYARDERAEDLAHAASQQPDPSPAVTSEGAAEAHSSSPPQPPDAPLNEQLRAIDVHITDWLEADLLEPHEALKARQLRADVRSRLRRDENYVNRKAA